MEWQPIETVELPAFHAETWYNDVTPRLLLFADKHVSIGAFGYTKGGKGRWRNWYGTINPTHWMHLPSAPVTP